MPLDLTGKTIAILAADGVEQVELGQPRDAVRDAGATTELLSIDTGEIHGPWTLVEADLARGRTLTSLPSVRTDIRNTGGTVIDEEVVVDQGLVSSRDPHDLPGFCAKIIEEFAEGLHAVHDEWATA